MAIKYRLGRLPIPVPPRDYIPRQVNLSGASLLPIHFRHAVAAGALDSEHKDPFDRILAAQCFEEDLPCITKDPFFSLCGVRTIW